MVMKLRKERKGREREQATIFFQIIMIDTQVEIEEDREMGGVREK